MKMILAFFSFVFLLAQKGTAQPPKQNIVFVDKKGVLRYTRTKAEASFFGVNYTVPFAYGYRSHKALGIDPEKAIDADVNHMARLGLNAFRVHVWDVEISDSLGNLLQNEHLRLFDYLLYKLKQHNIKILLTPIAFWGSGYPEPDIKTIGFASVYGKGPSVVREEAFRAQENYLRQFFQHVNAYTGQTYRDDRDVIAMEINNEPHHSGPRERTTEYVNRMASAVRSTGWTKPIFYNISESPNYAGAVAKGKADGFSFQWYPTGLVANHEHNGNFLPNVDRYHIPFIDTVPEFLNRPRMVYEFDAGDVMQPVMYPAMARSFRAAGFQWATQFAYDPLHTAYGNTEYQTHYLNLVYTPAKAISLLIAAKAFLRLPHGKIFGAYPADTLFDVFRVSYNEQLSEMNSEEEFYYTSNTVTQPKNGARLKHLAGTGSSPVVQYEGTGAYFLDNVSDDGVWRLEIFPDAIATKDPFEKASPRKTVARIQWRQNRIKLLLPSFSPSFTITGANAGNDYNAAWSPDGNRLKPGVYFIRPAGSHFTNDSTIGVEFYAPPSSAADPEVVHQPLEEVTPGTPFLLTAIIVGIDTTTTVSVEFRHSANRWRTVPMQRTGGYHYSVNVSSDVLSPGLLNYRIIVKNKGGDTYTFPGGFKGDPYAWDEYRAETWQTVIAAPESHLSLFDPAGDRKQLLLFNPDWRNNTVEYVTAGPSSELVWKATMKQPAAGQMIGFQYYFGKKIKGRKTELPQFTRLSLRVRSSRPANLQVSLLSTGAGAFGTAIPVGTEWQHIEIPLNSLRPTDFLLLPRPYPGFQPLLFKTQTSGIFELINAERMEVRYETTEGGAPSPLTIELGGAWLMK